MKFIAAVLTLGALGASVAEAQDIQARNVTRIHLRNGNCVEGDLLRETSRGWVLRMPAGEISLRRDQVDHVETQRVICVLEPAPKPQAPGSSAPQLLSARLRDEAKPRGGAATEATSGNRKTQLLRQLRRGGDGSAAEVIRSLHTLQGDDLKDVTDAVCERADVTALPQAQLLLDSGRADLRVSAVMMVAALAGLGGRADLRPKVEDPDPHVRACAVRSLAAISDISSLALIGSRLPDPDEDVRAQARTALFSLASAHNAGDDVLRLLLEKIIWTEGESTVEILAAIGSSGRKEAWEPVARYLWNPVAGVRAQAALTLSQLAAPEAAEILLQRLELEQDYWPRVQLAGAVQALKLKAAVDPLLAWMEDDNKNIRMAAVRALRQITGQSFGMDREKWVTWWQNAKPREVP